MDAFVNNIKKKEENKRYEKYDRNPAIRRRYGRVWKRVRDSYVRAPYCELCFEKGMMVQVEEVHHKKPLSEGRTHARNNLISLCKSCHARIHATNGSRWNKKKRPLGSQYFKGVRRIRTCLALTRLDNI